MSSASKADILKTLQADILRLQGFKPAKHNSPDTGLGFMDEAFPNGSFPLGAIHEFLSDDMEDRAPVSGFIAGLLASLTGIHGAILWISAARMLFPPALKSFGLEPDRFIFLDLKKEKDVLWAMDEALKCGALSAVIGEVNTIDFTASRRLQLAVEQSQVTGFLVRRNQQKLNTTACVSRWRITSQPSIPDGNMPGIGFPKWKVELLRMRNGRPGVWDIQWIDGRFSLVHSTSTLGNSPASKSAFSRTPSFHKPLNGNRKYEERKVG